MISQARSYSEVAALLRAAISQGAATVVTSGAALDRLRAVNARNQQGSREQLQAACELAFGDLLRRLPHADLRSLATLARAAFQLRVPVPQEEQQPILSKFISLVRAWQNVHAAKAMTGPPPPKPGWVQIKLSEQEPSAAAGASGATGEHGDGSSSSSSSSSGPMQPGLVQARVGEVGVSVERRQANQSVSYFVWATLSNAQWQWQEGELAALMQCVQQQAIEDPVDCTRVLVGLVRYAARQGHAAVGPYVQEGGPAEALLHRVLSHLSMLTSDSCSDTLKSIGRLQLRSPPGTLAALFKGALVALEGDAPQPTTGTCNSRFENIAQAFLGLSMVCNLAPEECREALEVPEAQEVAQEFAEWVTPAAHELWTQMVTACCQLGFNPVGSQQVPLLEVLLKHLPGVSSRLSFFDRLDVLVSVAQAYGPPPVGGALVEQLKPHRQGFAKLAGRCLTSIHKDASALESWQAYRRYGGANVMQLLDSYSRSS
ncbi:hypothetical protein N2152v2_010037 [Parachlorella kessleri]